jgi:5-methylcytosine-specific restriction endonuclease McrA
MHVHICCDTLQEALQAKCQICGKSPAIQHGVVLHIDHIVLFTKGGKTVLENLRTPCSECNIGKGNDESV